MTITIDITLSDNDLFILRRIFTNKDRIINIYFKDIISESLRHQIEDLDSKGIVKVNNMGNTSLTDIGKLIFDKIDRDKRIDDILN